MALQRDLCRHSATRGISRVGRLSLPVCCLLLGLFLPASAQPTAGSIVGRVTDASPAVVPRAVVKVKNQATGFTATTETDFVGEYRLPTLPPGIYELTAAKPGFTTAQRPDLELQIDQKLRVDIELALGVVSGADTVTAPVPALQTQSAETGQVIGSRQIQELPLLGRNFLDLARLAPGVTYASGSNTLNLSVNGQREFANSVLVDGVESTGNRNNDTSQRPSLDSVDQFKVVTSSYAAEFGRSGAAVIAIETASGTNHLHGDLYEFFRPNTTAARTFFAADPSPLKQHDFGATLGGPLRRNRTFFFTSYEGVRLRNAFSFLDSVPPTGQIGYPSTGGADLSRLLDPSTGRPIPIFDPNAYAVNFVAEQFPGNIIPASRLSPAGKAVLQNFFPAPDRAGTLHGWFSNFVSRQSYLFDSDTADGRLDHLFSERDRISAVYHYGSFGSNTGDRFAGHIPVAGGGDADYGDRENSRNQALSVAATHVLSSRAIDELRFGYTRYRLDQLSLLDGRNLADRYGVGNVNLPGYPQTSGFPDIYLGFGAQTGGSTFKPLHFLDSNYHLSDAVSARLGVHDFKAGAEFRRLRSNPFFSLFPTGFQFYGGSGLSLTADPNFAFYDSAAFYSNGGSDIADLLLGLPYTVNLGLQLTNPATQSWETGFYAQDAWQLRKGLVLTYGLRYEYFSPWRESDNGQANFDPATRQVLLAGRGGNSASLIQPDRNNFAPRLGLAWQVTPRTVLRAGWGIFYSPESDAREDLLTKNYPFAAQSNVFNNISGGLPFAYLLDKGVARSIPVVPQGVSTIDPAAIRQATGVAQNFYTIDPNLRTGYSQLYNFTLQRQLTQTLTLQAGYVGAISRDLPYAVGNINIQNRLTADLGQIHALYAEGSGNFNSLQVEAVQRLSRHQSVRASYTWGKNLDNGPAPFNLGHNQNQHNQPQDPFQLQRERAPADSDVRHNLVVSYLYELPFAKGQRGWKGAVFGGWQLNGIAVARTGLPVNVVRNPQDTGYEGLRPDVERDPNLPSSARTLSKYFDTTAFSKTRFAGNAKHALGDAGRNLVRGPGLVNLDFSACKGFRLREQVRIELRGELFNLTNTAHFANPEGNMSAGSFGSITQTIANPRIIQFAAKLRF